MLYIARAPFVSGAERALASMLRHLDRSRIEPSVVLGAETPLVQTIRDMNIPVAIVPLAKRGATTFISWRISVAGIEDVLLKFKPDVLHANDVPSCQAMSVLGQRHNIPRVIHVRWTITAQDAGWWSRAGADSVLCISQWIKDQLGNPQGTTLAASQIEVLPDAVDWPADHTLSPGERAGVRAASPTIQSPTDRPTLAFAGQLIPSKGLDLVIEALSRVPQTNRPKLLIAGKDTQSAGEYEKSLRDLAQRVGVTDDIEWLGFLDDVSRLYERASAVVCPSREEPLGLVPLEAARFFLPALASRVGGLTETIVDNQTGWLIDPTVDAWSTALSKLSDRAALQRMGQAAHDRTQSHYSPMIYQQRLMVVYKRLATT